MVENISDAPLSQRSRRGRPANSNAEETRVRLMRAAARQFSQAEFSAVSMGALAEEAGLTGAAIYNHFASKEALFIATSLHMMRENLDALKKAMDAESSWRDKLHACLMLFCESPDGWFRYPLLTPVIQLKSLQNPGDFSEVLATRREFADVFEGLITDAVDAGDLPIDLHRRDAAELLVGFVFNGVGAVMGHRQNEDQVRRVVDTAASLLGATLQAKSPTASDE